MRLKKLNSSKLVLVNINKYLIDWRTAPSKGQQVLQDFLYPFWKNHFVAAELRIPGSLMRVDIFNATLRAAVEYSPESHHGSFNAFFHKNRSNYLKSLKRDEKKEIWCAQNNIKFIEIFEKDLKILSKEFFMEEFDLYL